MSVKTLNFNEKLSKLDELLAWFESDAVSIESTPEKYDAALKLIKELEAQLGQTKNKIEVLKKQT